MCEAYRGCRCYRAVTNAYEQLKTRGVTELSAFDTATVIYRFHHPEKTVQQARSQISDWLASDNGPAA